MVRFRLTSSPRPELREGADYDALAVEREQASRAIDSAQRFLAALDELLD
jgi:uncharacterized protein (UPF0332 family)